MGIRFGIVGTHKKPLFFLPLTFVLICQPWHFAPGISLVFCLKKTRHGISAWTYVSLQMLMLKEWTYILKSSLQDEISCSFPFLLNTSSVCQQGLSQREVCCLPVEEMANSKLKQVNAVVKEKNEGWPVPLCAVYMGSKWLMLWTACYRLLTAWHPTFAADVWPVIPHGWSVGLWGRKNAGMWSRRRLLHWEMS